MMYHEYIIYKGEFWNFFCQKSCSYDALVEVEPTTRHVKATTSVYIVFPHLEKQINDEAPATPVTCPFVASKVPKELPLHVSEL